MLDTVGSMSRFFAKFKGEKSDHSHLAPEQNSLASNNPYRYVEAQPPAYEPPNDTKSSHTSPLTANVAGNSQNDDNPPPYHDWTSIEDTALLPPPPPITSDHSSTSNATYDEAAAAHAWCARHLVYTPQIPNVNLVEAVQAGQHGIDLPPDFQGRLTLVNSSSKGATFTPTSLGSTPTTVAAISTRISPSKQAPSGFNRRFLGGSSSNNSGNKPGPDHDQIFLTRLPLYFAATSNPLSPHFSLPKASPSAHYFEVTPTTFHTSTATIAVGFAAKPYPPGRQPGWHRASFAVHSDDGNRYVNDSWGGRPFTSPIVAGETVGIAVQISPEEVVAKANPRALQSEREVRSSLPKCKTRVWLVRNGAVSGSWDMDEERDAERDEGVAGLKGEVDLYAAIGVYGAVDFEVRFFAAGDGFVPPPEG